MYEKILLCLDNSEDSLKAASVAAALAAGTGAQAIALHVYAALLHNDRFMEMETTLPEKYREENELKRQREIHASLIKRGLEIISDSYAAPVARTFEGKGLTIIPAKREGRHYEEILKETTEGSYGLVILGRTGLGRTSSGRIGGVSMRITRECTGADVLVVQNDILAEASSPIVVCVDGSASAYYAVKQAATLSKLLNARLTAVAAFDPEYHRVAFKSISGVLSNEDAKLFRFKEQEKLHDEIIDSNLAEIYKGYLNAAKEIAAAEGVKMETVLLEGKASDEVVKYAASTKPSLLVTGRFGRMSIKSDTLGMTAENILRETAVNVLIASGSLEVKKNEEDPLLWENAAEELFKKIPGFVRSMVRKMAEDEARRLGLRKVTVKLLEDLRRKISP